MKDVLDSASPNCSLFPLWDMERQRIAELGDPPLAGTATYYKRMMLRALFISDADFNELIKSKDTNLCSPSVQRQLVRTGLATLVEEIDGDHFILEEKFREFLNDPDAPRLRQLCKEVLDSVPEMHWFFEDIRETQRRRKMAEIFLT